MLGRLPRRATKSAIFFLRRLGLGGMRERRLQILGGADRGRCDGVERVHFADSLCRCRAGLAFGLPRRRAIDALGHGRGGGLHQPAVHRRAQGVRLSAARIGLHGPVHEVRREARVARGEQRLRAPEQLVQAARERDHFLRQRAARRRLQFARHAAVPAAEAAPQVAHDELGLVVHGPQIGLLRQRGGRADLLDDVVDGLARVQALERLAHQRLEVARGIDERLAHARRAGDRQPVPGQQQLGPERGHRAQRRRPFDRVALHLLRIARVGRRPDEQVAGAQGLRVRAARPRCGRRSRPWRGAARGARRRSRARAARRRCRSAPGTRPATASRRRTGAS